MRRAWTSLFVTGVLVAAVAGTRAQDWPGLRGVDRSGASSAREVFRDSIGLDLVWKRTLGSGYSGIAVTGGRAFTLYSDGEFDYVVGLDAASGRELWRYPIDTTYVGHDGSDDGPLSTPTVAGDYVYALGPKGQLLALQASDGLEVWSVAIDETLAAEAPRYGFTTSPLVVGAVLVVQTGGSETPALHGLDGETGTVLWSAGTDRTGYQSPVPIELAGRAAVLAVGNTAVHGIRAETGEELFRYEHNLDDGDGFAIPVAIGDDRFLLMDWSGSVVLRLVMEGGRIHAEEAWSTSLFKRSRGIPVYHSGHLYGFNGSFLHCLEAGSGRLVWRSRPPGGRGLILVDDHLVILAPGGVLVVAEASPAGYREKARLEVFDRGSHTWPSFADGRILVRNLNEIASVAVRRGGSLPTQRPETPPRLPAGSKLGALLAEVPGAINKRELVDDFLRKQEQLPVIEGSWVHFVYNGEVEDIAITGSMTETYEAQPMFRLKGTDLYYRSYRLEPDARWEYRFNVDFENYVVDPRNPRVVPGERGESSEVVMPQWKEPNYLAEPEGPRGTLTELDLSSNILENDRKVTLYLPPDLDRDAELPLMIVVDGQGWIDNGLLTHALDNLVGRQVRPLAVAFVGRPERDWWVELSGSQVDAYARMLRDELLPLLRGSYRLASRAADRALLGAGDAAFAALYSALLHPDVFGKAAAFSPLLPTTEGDRLLARLEDEITPAVDLYLDWNRYEKRNAELGFDYRADALRLAAALEEAGLGYRGGEAADSHGWGSWRARVDRVLIGFFPSAGGSD